MGTKNFQYISAFFRVFGLAHLACAAVSVSSFLTVNGAQANPLQFAQSQQGQLQLAQLQPKQIPGTLGREREALPQPQSSKKPLLPKPATSPVPSGAQSHQFILKQIEFTGGSVFVDEELKVFYQEFINEKIDVKKLFEIANRITRRYADLGYALSVAYLPAQKIDKGGIARINLVEGYIGAINYLGDVKALSSRNRRLIEKLRDIKPLTSEAIEQQLLLVKDTPGLDIKTTIDRAGFDQGAAKLLVDIQHKPTEWRLGLNNHGSSVQGPFRGNLGASLNGILLKDSAFDIRYQQAEVGDEYRYGSVNYGLPVSSVGTRFEIQGVYTESSPDLELLKAVDFVSESQQVSVSIRHPFYRTRRENFSGYLTLDGKNTEGLMLGEINTAEDSRVVRMGLQYDWIDGSGSTSLLHFSLNQGLDSLGATGQEDPLKGRLDSSVDFTSFKLAASRHQRFNQGASLYTHITVQHSDDPLSSSEQCGWGGRQFGRAYDDFEISADRCVMLSLELRNTVTEGLQGSNFLQSYVFFDAGRLWMNHTEIEDLSMTSDVKQSAGLGLRARFAERHFFSMEFALPLEDDVLLEGNKEPRMLINWQMTY